MLVSVWLLALAGPTACSGIKDDANGSTTEGSITAATNAGGAAAAGSAPVLTMAGMTAGPGLDLGGTGGSAGAPATQGGSGGACAASYVQAKVKTLAMFVMLDQSKSMDQVVDAATMTSRWDAVTTAFAAFVNNPVTADFPVGLQYFGLPQSTSSGGAGGGGGSGGMGGGGRGPVGIPGGGPLGNVSCVVSDYAQPEVPIAPLAMNAKAITDSMAAHAPLTTTPTLPAVQGGIQFVAKYAMEHPDHKVVLVLATDGEPSGCDSTLDNVTAAAAMGLSGMPSIRTYVIGVGDNLSNLDAIAKAGGTEHAFLVSDGNVQQDLLKALTAIQGADVPCEYSVPVPMTGKEIDFGKVNVQYSPTTGTSQVLQKVNTVADCVAGSKLWYYDNNAAPTQIVLCEDTCEQLTTAGAGKVEIVLDCKETVVKPPT